jgi:3-hydroxyisobutyrate dehydrogenase-like beta-hydroxyacid dehydrogenase
MRIGCIGTGTMGKPMARNCLSKAGEMTIYARSATQVQDLVDDGAVLVTSPAEVAAACDVIVLSLPFDPDVEAVVRGDNGILSSARPGTVIADTTTGTPHGARTIEAAVAAKGVHYLDAPVSGGLQGAIDGMLTFLVGGEQKALEKARPALALMGTTVFHTGAVGSGRTMKALNQIISALNTLTLCESVVLGKKLGIEPSTMYEVLGQCAANSYHLQFKLPSFIIPGHFDKGHRIEMMTKDLDIALDIARQKNVALLLTGMATQLYRAAASDGFARKDISSMVDFLGSFVGVRFNRS